MTKALLIAAPRSGAGKTTVTLGLLRALKRRGVRVRAAKCGPDYIDPAFHAVATGAPSINLDGWAMPPAQLETALAEAGLGADILVIEASMGLFDGVTDGAGSKGSAAELAIRFGVPVLLVLNVAAQAQSAAAELFGFARFDARLDLAGAVLNRLGSPRHRAMIEAALAPLGIPVVGALQRDASIHLPERHLGLVQALEHGDLEARLDHLADLIERHCDIDLMLQLAGELPAGQASATLPPPPGQRIALARDAAFSFVYPHLLSAWRGAGAETVVFSPLADEAPPADCDCCWLPGGYPELHAGRLAEARRFTSGLAEFAAAKPVHGECGGYMVLGEALIDSEGVAHKMAGLLSHVTSFASRKLHLGYRSASLLADCLPGAKGDVLRGHEFHYATLAEPGSDAPLAELCDAEGNPLGPAGGRRGRVTGSFFHLIASDTIASHVKPQSMEHA
jgi:cobyrinic acid a,c-diamide synthase